MSPKVSVLTPLYNTDPNHLREMIDGVLAQTFTDFEFLILNDSPDNRELKKIVKSYNDPRIKYFENETNLGISASRNKLIDLAKGEYLAVHDHDDISVPDRFARQVEYLDNDPTIGVVSGWLEFFGAAKYLFKNPQKNYAIKPMLATNCVVAHTASMIRKSILTDNNIRYEQRYSPAEDYMLWCRLIEFTEFHNIQDVLVKYRWFDGNTSTIQRQKMIDKDFEVRLFVQTKYPNLASLKPLPNKNTKIKLFGVIPFMSMRCRPSRQTLYLFGFIPLLRFIKK